MEDYKASLEKILAWVDGYASAVEHTDDSRFGSMVSKLTKLIKEELQDEQPSQLPCWWPNLPDVHKLPSWQPFMPPSFAPIVTSDEVFRDFTIGTGTQDAKSGELRANTSVYTNIRCDNIAHDKNVVDAIKS